jgi:large subunit ribosomal protein L35
MQKVKKILTFDEKNSIIRPSLGKKADKLAAFRPFATIFEKESKMPKVKNKSAIKKRFKLTATGKVKGGHVAKRHLLMNKPRKMKLKARGSHIVGEVVANIVKKFMH